MRSIKSIGLFTFLLSVLMLSTSAQTESASFQTFELVNLLDELDKSEESALQFLSESSMDAEIHVQTASGESISLESEFDQVFYVFEGQSEWQVENELIEIDPGSALFTKGGTDPSLVSLLDGERLIFVGVTLKHEVNVSSAKWRLFTIVQMEAPRSQFQNVWNPFLRENNVIFGLYMLPQPIGGDGRLVHPFDELNIVVRGKGVFEVDSGQADIMESSIMFVRAGLGHYFHSLEEDTDILILWEQP